MENEIWPIFSAYLHKEEISIREKQQLENWLRENPEHQDIFRQFGFFLVHCHEQKAPEPENIDAQWMKNLQRLDKRRKNKKRTGFEWWKYAALGILLLGVGFSLYHLPSLREEGKPEDREEAICFGSSQATLVLSSGKKIKLQQKDGLLAEEASGRISNENNILKYRSREERIKKSVDSNRLEIPRGGEYQLILEDSTVVWLNSASELHYPVAFGNGVRRVVLKGEAYFQVKADKNRPFVVAVGGLDITVLGTEFNVSTFVGGEGVCATLVKGSVEVSVKGSRRVMLKPSEQAVYVNDKLSVREVNTLLYTAWKDGFYVFERQELEELLNTLARWYNVEIVYADDEIRHMHFTGRLKRYEDFGRCLSRIKMTNDVDFLIRGRTITVKRK